MTSSLVNSLAKVYDPKPLHAHKLAGRKFSLGGGADPRASCAAHDASLRGVETRMDSLSAQMEHLLGMQHAVLARLDGLAQDVRGMGRDLAAVRGGEGGPDGRQRRGSSGSGVEAACRELLGAVERASERIDSQGRRLEGVEKLVEGTQQVISFIGGVVKNSRLVELLFRQPGTNRKVRRSRFFF